MRRLIHYTAVWYQADDLPMESTWLSVVAAIAFADAIFQRRHILAVKIWQGGNPEDPFRPVWQDDPLLLYKKIKPLGERYFFHFQIPVNASLTYQCAQ